MHTNAPSASPSKSMSAADACSSPTATSIAWSNPSGKNLKNQWLQPYACFFQSLQVQSTPLEYRSLIAPPFSGCALQPKYSGLSSARQSPAATFQGQWQKLARPVLLVLLQQCLQLLASLLALCLWALGRRAFAYHFFHKQSYILLQSIRCQYIPTLFQAGLEFSYLHFLLLWPVFQAVDTPINHLDTKTVKVKQPRPSDDAKRLQHHVWHCSLYFKSS